VRRRVRVSARADAPARLLEYLKQAVSGGEKLRVHSKSEAVAKALRNRLVRWSASFATSIVSIVSTTHIVTYAGDATRLPAGIVFVSSPPSPLDARQCSGARCSGPIRDSLLPPSR
jgi:hypothetical protein